MGRCASAETVEVLDEESVRAVLADSVDTAILVTADEPVDAERMAAVAGRAQRRSLLEVAPVASRNSSGPAHDGHDWSFFSGSPMRGRLIEAFRIHPTDRVCRFVLPYQRARSESKFYFDQWQLTESPLPEYVEEV